MGPKSSKPNLLELLYPLYWQNKSAAFFLYAEASPTGGKFQVVSLSRTPLILGLSKVFSGGVCVTTGEDFVGEGCVTIGEDFVGEGSIPTLLFC